MQTINLEEITTPLNEALGTPQAAPQATVTRPQPTPDDYAQRKARAVLYAAKAKGTSEGGRNFVGYKLVAAIREKFGLLDSDILDILSDWNKKNTPDGLIDAELSDIVKNADRYAKRPAGSGIDLPDLPETLPLILISTVKSKHIDWLLHNRFPNRSINLIGGLGGAGKTFIAADLISRITTGRDYPDSKMRVKPGSCIVLGEEDDFDTVWRPRLDAAGADVNKVFFFDYEKFFSLSGQSFTLAGHTRILDKTVSDTVDCRAVFFDPLNGYLGRINAYSDNEARSVLIPLQNIAKKHNIAIFGLCHLSKKADSSAIDRVLGSVAFVNAARSVHLVTHDKETGIRYLTIEKANYSIDPTNLSFRIVDGAVAFIEGTTTKTADDILQAGRQKSDSTVECTEWLRKKLQFNSELAVDVQEQAKIEGFSRYALDEAKRTLRVVSKKDSFNHGKWRLYLPDKGDLGVC